MKYLQPTWAAPTNIKAYMTLRDGWTGRNNVIDGKNGTERLINLLNLPQEPIWLQQTHSTKIVEATPQNKNCMADASFTREKDQVCVILTADCLPILICNQQGTLVVAIHAGWRGLVSGIIDNALSTIAQPPHELIVWCGPAIGVGKFEVGLDVYEAFMAKNPSLSRFFLALDNKKWRADLYGIARAFFESHGIPNVTTATDISPTGLCTYSYEDLFFSYRRDKENTGRMATLIWIDGKT